MSLPVPGKFFNHINHKFRILSLKNWIDWVTKVRDIDLNATSLLILRPANCI